MADLSTAVAPARRAAPSAPPAPSAADVDADLGEDDPIRERLVAAAAQVFSERGYDRAGVQEIARRAGLTTGAIYGRFTGKAELLQAAIDRHTRSELERLFADDRFEGRATDVLRAVGSHLVTREGNRYALVLEAMVAARRDPDVADLMAGLLGRRAEQVEEVVSAAQERGQLDPTLDRRAVAMFCHAVGLGFLLIEAADLDRPDPEPWDELIGRVIAGLAAPGAPRPQTPQTTAAPATAAPGDLQP